MLNDGVQVFSLLKALVGLLQNLFLTQGGLGLDLVHSVLKLVHQIFPERSEEGTHDDLNHSLG